MIRPSSVGIWLLSCLVVTNTAMAKTTSYETAFDLKVFGFSIGQVIVSFEDRISAGKTTVDASIQCFLKGSPPFHFLCFLPG